MDSKLQDAVDREQLLGLVIEAYLDARDSGNRPDPNEWLRRYPELGEELAGFFALQAECLGLIKPLRDIVASKDCAPFVAGHSFGDYELLEELGRGGMGVVYKARQHSLDRVVALKMILSGHFASSEDVQRFRREAQAVARLRHPNIVAIYEVGQHEGLHYFSMDYVDGITLSRLIRESSLTPVQAAELVIGIASAVQYSHLQGIVHRDLKPSNVLIDRTGRPQVTDFGLARWMQESSDLTASGTPVGTPSYMSPEQAIGRGDGSRPESDVYSLGAILYELLAGRPPFRAATVNETVKQVIESEPAGLRYLDRSIPRDAETICLKCLQKPPEKRYPSAQELADDLGRFLKNEPILARPVGRLERAVRWCRRNKAKAGLVAASVLVLAIILGWGVRELRQQSEILISNAELLAQRGQWRAAQEQLNSASWFGSADPIRLRLLRIRADIALSSGEYAKEVEALSQRDDLGEYAAPVHLLQGMSLAMRGEQQAGIELVRLAKSLGTLQPADAAIADALLAETSPELVRHLERAVRLDPLSHEAQSYLTGALLASGRFDDAIQRGEIAAAFFPDSPTFPIALASVAALKGNRQQAIDYLKMRGCQQLSPETIDSLAKMLAAIVNSFNFIAGGFDFDMTPEEFEKLRQATQERHASDLYPPIAQSMEHFGISAEAAPEAMVQFVGKAGIPCISKAYRPWHDALSLRTFGFLMTGKGSTKRIDEIIERCEESSRIHPDGLFQCVRGRLLYARGRLAEAADAYAQATALPCSVPVLRKDAFAHAARCYFELYKQGQIDALPKALQFVKQRIAMGPVGAGQAEVLSSIAFASGDLDSARQLLQRLESVKNPSWTALKRAEIELAADNYLSAVKIASGIPEDAEEVGKAMEIKREALRRARQRAEAVAEAVE